MSLKSRLSKFVRRRPRVAVLRLYGPIGMPGPGGLSDAGLSETIERAFDSKPAAVALAVNCPGGSPTQSALVAARIRRRADETGIPVYAFAEDVAASGGYWLACAADEIWADDNSILGSIGVISAGFGFQDAIAKLGVERRVHSAGERKSMLDPFQEEKPGDVEELKALQKIIHDNFIAHVRARRGAKLPEDRNIFTGEFWTGAEAVRLGLADGLGHLRAVMQAKLGDEIRWRVHAPKRGLLQRAGLPGATEAADAVVTSLEARLMFSRYGA